MNVCWVDRKTQLKQRPPSGKDPGSVGGFLPPPRSSTADLFHHERLWTFLCARHFITCFPYNISSRSHNSSMRYREDKKPGAPGWLSQKRVGLFISGLLVQALCWV